MPTLSDDEKALLWRLVNELPALCRKIELAQLIGRYPRARECRNAALAFGFNHASVAIIETMLLRFAEALDLIEKARRFKGMESLFAGRGRLKRAKDEDFHLLLELRSKRVAHHVKLRAAGDVAFEALRGKYEHVFAFLLVTAAKISEQLEDLDERGLFIGLSLPPKTVAMPASFTPADLDALLDAANSIARQDDVPSN